MQITECSRCINAGKKCNIIRIRTTSVLVNILDLLYYSQSNNKDYTKCKLNIECNCENFTSKEKEDKNAE